MSELLLQTRNLTKQYGRHRAVDDVNMHIKKGAIYGFIGRNGAGKTTCLKMISGLSTPSYGEIEMFGYKGKDLQKVRSRVGKGKGLTKGTFKSRVSYRSSRTLWQYVGI